MRERKRREVEKDEIFLLKTNIFRKMRGGVCVKGKEVSLKQEKYIIIIFKIMMVTKKIIK